ncbi:hypothetical protein C8Q74DRAFT_1367714 [Fomes fomentarius]|nr:hypothetical protein C8Q74DRAFT_1367714 [Fomes fomentarius]
MNYNRNPAFHYQISDVALAHTNAKARGHIPVNAPIISSSLAGAHSANVFGPSHTLGNAPPDVVLTSSDRIQFYVHRERLFRASSSAFGGLLIQHLATFTLPESCVVLDVVLHVVYGMSCVQQNPSLDTIELALHALVKYGVALRPLCGPQHPLYKLLLLHAPYRPIEVYAIAAHHKLEDAAVAVSGHLLAYDTSKLSDELTVKMGPLYFRRLLDLHQARLKALKEIVLRPPAAHRPVAKAGSGCVPGQLTQGWAFAAAQLAWDTLPSVSTHALQAAFEQAGANVTCLECKAMLHARITEMTQEWSSVKWTI